MTKTTNTQWIGALLAALAAGSIAAASNWVNFVAPRGTYLAAWAVAHVLAFALGLWAARVLAGRRGLGTYLPLALLAGGVEAAIVFGLLDGLTIVDGGYETTLSAVGEDYYAVAAMVALFTVGALRGAHGLHAGSGPLALAHGDRPSALPSASATQFLGVIAGLVTITSEVIKLA